MSRSKNTQLRYLKEKKVRRKLFGGDGSIKAPHIQFDNFDYVKYKNFLKINGGLET